MESAALSGATAMLFRRYDLMRFWAATGQIDVERAARSDWKKEADALHACLARKLAETITDGIRLVQR